MSTPGALVAGLTVPPSPREIRARIRAVQADLDAVAARYVDLHDAAYGAIAAWRAEDVSLVGLSDPTASTALGGFTWVRVGLVEADRAVERAAAAAAAALAELRRTDRQLQNGSEVGRSWSAGDLEDEERRAWDRAAREGRLARPGRRA